jgi:hypothetical protein
VLETGMRDFSPELLAYVQKVYFHPTSELTPHDHQLIFGKPVMSTHLLAPRSAAHGIRHLTRLSLGLVKFGPNERVLCPVQATAPEKDAWEFLVLS